MKVPYTDIYAAVGARCRSSTSYYLTMLTIHHITSQLQSQTLADSSTVNTTPVASTAHINSSQVRPYWVIRLIANTHSSPTCSIWFWQWIKKDWQCLSWVKVSFGEFAKEVIVGIGFKHWKNALKANAIVINVIGNLVCIQLSAPVNALILGS